MKNRRWVSGYYEEEFVAGKMIKKWISGYYISKEKDELEKVKCIYCKKPIHISKWAGVNKKGFVCDNLICIMKAKKEIKK